MTELHGFELVRHETIDELNTEARLYKHIKTGAELLSLQNDDENKVFGVTFRTPPDDSTGVPHIIEHSVLAGSRKYPVKEPFAELVKGSLNTFVNAFTSPDKTTYPVASQNLQDFYNLVDVYLDAVFYPLLTENHLAQEGWHYELNNVDEPLDFKGIVFNEMKGAYSSPEGSMFRYMKQELFPDTPYRHDSGGDPVDIPNLTYEQFKVFHETYYHPSNARLYFYGDDPIEKRLEILNEYLHGFEAQAVDSAIPVQPLYQQARHATYPYSVHAEEADEAKLFTQLGWVLPHTEDPDLEMALSVMSRALSGTQASPLRKALLDSGLGEDIFGGGLSGWGRQLVYTIGLKGVAEEDVPAVERLILDTMTQVVDEGFEEDMVDAAINSIEFYLRENNTGSYPRGLMVMMRAMGNWVYDRDPLEALRYEGPLTAVKTQLAQNPHYLQELLKTYLLDNNHRVRLDLLPDPELAERLEQEERTKLDAVQAKLSEAELQQLVEQTHALRKHQETPDDPADLAKIPRLQLEDLEPKNKTIPVEISELHGSQLLTHDLFTNGIVYVDLAFDVRTVPQELLPYLDLFGTALTRMGTETESYTKLSQRIGRKTGGVYATDFSSAIRDSDKLATYLMMRGKSTVEQLPDLLAIMQDILLTVNLDDSERFLQLVLQTKASIESSIIPRGHGWVNSRLRSYFSPIHWFKEITGGIDYLYFLRQLADIVKTDWPQIRHKLEQVKEHIINRNALVCNVTLDDENWQTIQEPFAKFVSNLPANEVTLAQWQPHYPEHNEGLTAPAQVNYVAKGANLYDLGYELHGSIAVINNFVRMNYLWERIRMKGGAYGAFASFDKNSGVYSQVSYRDPNLLETIEVYDGLATYLQTLDLSDDERVKSIIGVIGSLDDYQLPDAKGYTSLVRHLLGSTDESRQKYREEVLNTTAEHFRAFGKMLEKVNEKGRTAVLTSPSTLEKINQTAEEPLFTPVKLL